MAKRLDRFPWQIVAVAAAWALLLLTWAMEVWGDLDTGPLRTTVAIGVLLSTPGYAFIHALYPERRLSDEESAQRHQERIDRRAGDDELALIAYREQVERTSLTGLQRLATSFGLSAAITGLVGLVVEGTDAGITWTSMAVVLGLWTAGWLAVAAMRWVRLEPVDRHCLQLPWQDADGTRDFSMRRGVAGVLLAVLLVAASLALVEAITGDRHEPSTSLYVLGELGDGRCYPTIWLDGRYRASLSAMEQECPDPSQNITIALVNREGRHEDYLLRTVWVQGYDRLNDTRPTALEAIESWTASVPPEPEVPRDGPAVPGYTRSLTAPPPPGNGTWQLFIQLYKDGQQVPEPAPSLAFVRSPYREVHLPIQVGLPE